MVAGGVGERVGREKERGGGGGGQQGRCVCLAPRARAAPRRLPPRPAAVTHHKNAHFDLDCGIPQNKPCGTVSVETTETFSMGARPLPGSDPGEAPRPGARGAE